MIIVYKEHATRNMFLIKVDETRGEKDLIIYRDRESL